MATGLFKMTHSVFGRGQPQPSIQRRELLVGIERIVTQRQRSVHDFLQHRHGLGPVFANVVQTHGLAVLQDPIFGTGPACVGPHPLCLVPKLFLHQHAPFHEQLHRRVMRPRRIHAVGLRACVCGPRRAAARSHQTTRCQEGQRIQFGGHSGEFGLKLQFPMHATMSRALDLSPRTMGINQRRSRQKQEGYPSIGRFRSNPSR